MKIIFFEKSDVNEKLVRSRLKNLELEFVKSPLSIRSISKARNASIISICVKSKINKETLSKLQKLKFIATRSTGFDHIDLEECRKRNILVSYTQDYGTDAVANFTFNLIKKLCKKIKGKTLGVIGAGRIGKVVIKLGKTSEMNVLAYDIFQDYNAAKELNFSYVDLGTLLEDSDVITLHSMLTKENYHLINSKNISKIKKGSIIINTARGALIETSALIKALKNKTISAAGLDVLEEENNPKNKKLLQLKKMKNVTLTPHIASKTKEALNRRLLTTIENIKTFLNKKPVNLV